MCLKQLFKLTPNEPWAHTYDPSHPNAPWVYAWLESYGGTTNVGMGGRLPDQHAEDKLILGYDPVAIANTTFQGFGDLASHCGIYVGFRAENITAKNQALLVFKLKSLGASAMAQFFLYNTFLGAHALASDDQHAILIDLPGPGLIVPVYVRLASSFIFDTMVFEGMDCCLV